eukprot:TRINITY_DN377_c0_g1_i1.p3 TRINITY_DN377_c0_g1~~TRINITY_DN377_c0_g1_i1.p3  ORF type:complete len:117 (+),score=1.30 TRINITY_DN377_c0_g1_i1:661-1011(+)
MLLGGSLWTPRTRQGKQGPVILLSLVDAGETAVVAATVCTRRCQKHLDGAPPCAGDHQTLWSAGPLVCAPMMTKDTILMTAVSTRTLFRDYKLFLPSEHPDNRLATRSLTAHPLLA